MGTKQMELFKNPFYGVVTDTQQLQREYYLNYFSKFPKQGKPSKDPPHAAFQKTAHQLHKAVKSENKHEMRCATPSYEAVKVKSKIRDILFNCNGNRLICNSKESIFCISPFTLNCEHSINCKSMQVIAHPNHPDIVAAIAQETGTAPSVAFYDIRVSSSTKTSQKAVLEFVSPYKDTFSNACWSPDGSSIVLADRSNRISTLRLAKGFASPSIKSLQSIVDSNSTDIKAMEFGGGASRKMSEAISSISFCGLGELLLVYCVDGSLLMYPGNPVNLDVEPLREKVRAASTNCCAVEREGSFVVSGGSDHTVNLVDLDTATVVSVYPKLSGQVGCISTSYDGKLLCWGTKDTSYSSEELSHGRSRDELNDKQECCLTIAGTNPPEIYYQHATPSPVVACDFHPSRYIVAYGCDYDSISRPSGSIYKMHPIGILTLE